MHEYELRPLEGGLVLSGGQLPEPLKYPNLNPEHPIRVVGFLSQRHGSLLHIFDAAGKLLETQTRQPVIPLDGAVGGLGGPTPAEDKP